MPISDEIPSSSGHRQTLLGSQLEYSQEIGGRECQDVGYSVISERDRERIALAVDTQSFVRSLEEAEESSSKESKICLKSSIC
jgi:hypothetical protein